MILVHHLLQEIVDIEFGATIYNGLNFVEQLLKFQALSCGNVVEGYLTVDGLNDLHLQDRLLRHRTHTHISLTLYLVLFTVALDQVYKLFGIGLADFSLTNTLNILQFFQGDRIVGGHLLNRHILENNIWRTFQLTANLLTKVLQHGTQRLVEGTDTCVVL